MTQNPNPQAKSPSKPRARWARAAVPLAILTVVAGFAITQANRLAPTAKGEAGASGGSTDACTGRAYAEIGGPFTLVNQDGRQVSERDFLGKPALIYFGFTYCPDICPTSLQTMRLALDASGLAPGSIQPVLVSLDPERDTPDVMKSYVASSGFPAGLVGLTGSTEQVTAAARAYKVSWRRAEAPDSSAEYLIDHSSIMYLIGSDGKLRTFFTDAAGPDAIGQCLAQLSRAGL
jgi:protein SCO1